MFKSNFTFFTTLCYMIFGSSAYITSDFGYFDKWFWKESWYCHVGNKYTYEIQFSSAFQNVPQVVISPTTVQNIVTSQTLYGYNVSITQITTTFFKVDLNCDKSEVGNLLLEWFALDDLRFEVFHFFNVPNPQTIIQQHSNKNALYGFVVFVNYYATKTADFTLKLGSISETNYTVLITQTNLLNLGYSVILGPKDAFSTTEVNNTVPTTTKACSAQVPIVKNQLWYFYPLYFSFPPSISLRFQLEQTLTSTYNSFCLSTWDGSGFTKFAHQCTTIYFDVLGFQPIKMQKIRISLMESSIKTNTIQLSIKELNKNYDSLVSEEFEETSSMTTFTLNITVICQPNQKVAAEFKKQAGSSTLYSISKNCFSRQNKISFYLIFVQSSPQYQYFNLSITTDQLIFQQKLINQQMEVATVAQVSILQQ